MQRLERVKNFVDDLFFAFTAGFVTMWIYVFMKAYQNNYVWTIDINYFGEAKIEAFIIVFYLLLFVIWSVFKRLK